VVVSQKARDFPDGRYPESIGGDLPCGITITITITISAALARKHLPQPDASTRVANRDLADARAG
jgi:hypothetical protein